MDFTGDDLLKVFKELDVQLYDLSPNVVKAWFDTDDKSMKNLLNWMCQSLSKTNYISPLEVTEYMAVETLIPDDDLDKELEHLENTKYPGIFDTEMNAMEIEFLEGDLVLARQQEKELEQEILRNRAREDKLTKELTKKVKEEIEISVKLKSTQAKCLAASEKLDSLNEEIHQHLQNCTKVLYDFEYSPLPNFINNFGTVTYQERLDNTICLLKPVLEHSPSVNVTQQTNMTRLDGIPIDDTIANNLCNMRHRILHSQHKHVATTTEIEKLNAINAYLEKITIESVLACDDISLNQSITMKVDTKKRLYDMLEDAITKLADRHLSQTQVKYFEQELEMDRENLNELNELEDMIQKLLSHYSLLGILYDQEKKDMENMEIFFKRVIGYIGRDMENCVIRTEKMKEIIENYNSWLSEERSKFSKILIKTLSSNEENFSIARAYELISNFKKETDLVEQKFLIPNFNDFRTKGKELRDSVKVLQSFLFSGPTHRVLLVPPELQIVIRHIEDLLKKELQSVKSALATVSTAKTRQSKWQNLRRQLWMYFYADPTRLKFSLQQIEEEFKKSKVDKM